MRPVGPEEEVICPKCRRYVGRFERCPYCGARVPTRLAVRLLKWGGLTIAVLGILFLYVDLHSTHIIAKEIPTVDISEITPMMNYANVCIQGKATFVRYNEDTKFLQIYVTDLDNESAEIYVQAYDTETKRLINMEKQRLAENSSEPKFPAAGDILTIRGQLIVRSATAEGGGFTMMRIQFAEGIKIERPEATRVTIENILSNPENFESYQRLEIEGKIIETRDGGWATFLTIYEMSTGAEMSLVIPKTLEEFGRTLEAKIGDMIRAKGALSFYFETPQLALASWDDLEVL